MSAGLLNLERYTPLELTLFLTCGALWVMTYIAAIGHIKRHKFIPLPILPFLGYTAWDLVWAYFYRTDMGDLIAWGLKVYAPLDLYMLWCVFRYGHKQFSIKAIQRNAPVVVSFVLAAWIAWFFFFIPGHDDSAGATSSFILMMMTSASLLPMLLRLYEQEGAAGLEKLSYRMGWIKLAANTAGTGFCFLHFMPTPERHWLLVVCVVMLILDVTYVAVFSHLRGLVRSRSAQRSGASEPLIALGSTAA
jgi:hypothetical protein